MVSIITPNYNCERYISKTIESVISQTYKDWELLIIDDNSNDKSFEIAKGYTLKDSRIKVYRNEFNQGAAFSRNRGLDMAKGEYVAFLDSDDVWEDSKLEKQIFLMDSTNSDFCYTSYDLIDEKDTPLGKEVRIPKSLTYHKYLHHCFTGCLTVVYRFSMFKEIRSFNIKNNNDYGLFLQVVKKSDKVIGLDECLAHYRIRTSSISRNKLKKIKPYFELMHDCLHFPYILSIWFLFTNITIGKIWKYKKRKFN